VGTLRHREKRSDAAIHPNFPRAFGAFKKIFPARPGLFLGHCVTGVALLLRMLLPHAPVCTPVVALCCAVAVCAPAAGAPAAGMRSFNLPQGDAAVTLKQFSAAAGTPIVYLVDRVRGSTTNAVRGEYAPREALERMLAGSALEAAQDAATGALVVSRKRTAEAAQKKGEVGPVSDPQPNPPAKPMKTPRTLLAALAGWLAASTTAVDAQTASMPPKEETVMLTPFEVSTSQDKGYTATSTLSGGRIATSLKDTPAVIGVLTREFLDDIMAQSITDFANWAPNTLMFGVDGNSNTTDRDLAQPRMRGLGSSFSTARNYFGTSVPMDGFNTERLEIPRGPNALLFGDGALGGITTTSTKRALFGRSISSASIVLDDWGSRRGTVDLNRRVTEKAAVRLNLLNQRNKLWRDSEFYNRDSLHGAITYRPWKNGELRGEAEYGHTERDGEDRIYTDQASNWNRITTAATTTAGLTPGAAGTGTSRVSTGNNYWVWDTSAPSLGLVNWQNTVQTTGSSRSILAPEFDPATYRPGLANFPRLKSRDYTVGPKFARNSFDYYILTAYFSQTFGKLAMEFAYNYETRKSQWFRDRHNQYFIDLNETLPSGASNPKFGKVFDDAQVQRQYTEGWSHGVRGTLAYPFDFGFTKQSAVLMASAGQGDSIDHFYRLVRTNNPAQGNLQQAANIINTRRYWSDGAADPYSLPVSGNGVDLGYTVNQLQGSKNKGSSAQFATVGSYFKNKLSSIFGYRIDSQTSDSGTSFSTTNDWRVNGVRTTDFRPLLKGESTAQLLRPDGQAEIVYFSKRADLSNNTLPYDPVKNPRLGEIYPLTKTVSTFSAGTVYFPVKYLGAFVNVSTGFSGVGFNQKINFAAVEPLEKKGVDAGLKLELFDGRLSGTISAYRSSEKGYGASVSSNPAGPIWSTAITGYQQSAAAAQTNGDAALAATYTTKATEAQQQFQSIVTNVAYFDTQNTQANGYEIDLTGRPTPNWSVMFNFAVPKATTTNRLQDLKAYNTAFRKTFESYAADTAGLTAAQRTTVTNQLTTLDGLINNAVDGYTLDQVPKFNANFFTSYRFTQGAMKGFRLGGGVQARGEFKLATSRQVYGVNPANGLTQFYAPNLFDTLTYAGYNTYTLTTGYEMKVRKVRLNFQLNVSNLLDEDKVLFNSYVNYTYTDRSTGTAVTKGVQAPQNFRYIDPRKISFSISAGF
jgi:iron complex outermembrane receptor protein